MGVDESSLALVVRELSFLADLQFWKSVGREHLPDGEEPPRAVVRPAAIPQVAKKRSRDRELFAELGGADRLLPSALINAFEDQVWNREVTRPPQSCGNTNDALRTLFIAISCSKNWMELYSPADAAN